MQQYLTALGVNRPAQLRNLLNGADFIIHQHNAGHNGIRTHHILQNSGVQAAVGIHRHQIKVIAQLQHSAHRLNN